MKQNNLLEIFGNIDIYLFDQILKGNYDNSKKVIDIGCGGGRNIHYFLQNGYDVFGIDQDWQCIEEVKKLAIHLAPSLAPSHFCVGLADNIPFPNNSFDLAISSAVLHFARDLAHFEKMLGSAWNVIRPGGFLFARLASDIGIENKLKNLGNKRYLLPDGSERFLVNENDLLLYGTKLKGHLYEPIKTTNVQNLRCMTTWCLQKME